MLPMGSSKRQPIEKCIFWLHYNAYQGSVLIDSVGRTYDSTLNRKQEVNCKLCYHIPRLSDE